MFWFFFLNAVVSFESPFLLQFSPVVLAFNSCVADVNFFGNKVWVGEPKDFLQNSHFEGLNLIHPFFEKRPIFKYAGRTFQLKPLRWTWILHVKANTLSFQSVPNLWQSSKYWQRTSPVKSDHPVIWKRVGYFNSLEWAQYMEHVPIFCTRTESVVCLGLSSVETRGRKHV